MKKATKPMTSTERQRELRARRLSDGLTEVRGIYAKQENHQKLKEHAKMLAKSKDKC